MRLCIPSKANSCYLHIWNSRELHPSPLRAVIPSHINAILCITHYTTEAEW